MACSNCGELKLEVAYSWRTRLFALRQPVEAHRALGHRVNRPSVPHLNVQLVRRSFDNWREQGQKRCLPQYWYPFERYWKRLRPGNVCGLCYSKMKAPLRLLLSLGFITCNRLKSIGRSGGRHIPTATQVLSSQSSLSRPHLNIASGNRSILRNCLLSKNGPALVQFGKWDS